MTDSKDEAIPQAVTLDVLPELLGAAVGGLWQLAGGDPLSSGLLTAGTTVALRLDVQNRAHRLQRAARVVEDAAAALGGLSRLEELTAADDARLEFTCRVLEAAARTNFEDKLLALSRVLAMGLRDDAVLDEAGFLAAAIQDLEAPHVEILNALVEGDQLISREASGWSDEQLRAEVPNSAALLGSILNTLERHELVRRSSATWPSGLGYDRPGPFTVTPLGERLLALLAP